MISLFIDGMGQGLAHPPVGEPGIVQVVPQIDVREGHVAILFIHPLELGVLRLAGILDGIEAHTVKVAGLELHEHGGRVRFHQIDVAVEIGAALKIVGVVGQGDLFPGPPLLEDIGAGADGVPPQG